MRSWAPITVLMLVILSIAAAQKAQKHSVTIKGMAFSPSSVKVKVGDTVVWSNKDDQDHTVVAKDGSFNSGNLKPGDSFSHKFSKAGTFSYACGLHPRMKGSVGVSD